MILMMFAQNIFETKKKYQVVFNQVRSLTLPYQSIFMSKSPKFVIGVTGVTYKHLHCKLFLDIINVT